jgi:hypothetical protein
MQDMRTEKGLEDVVKSETLLFEHFVRSFWGRRIKEVWGWLDMKLWWEDNRLQALNEKPLESSGTSRREDDIKMGLRKYEVNITGSEWKDFV